MTEYIKRKWWGMSPLMRRLSVCGAVLCFCCLVVALATDNDSDQMPDEWEVFYGLDPGTNDASFNYDEDGLTNLEESQPQKLTDPFAPDSDRDGWNDDYDDEISRVWIDFQPQFISGDRYEYAAPDFFLGALKIDGDWVTNPAAWYVPATASNFVGSFNLFVDRTLLNTNTILNLAVYDSDNSSTFVNLLDGENRILATNLFGNLLEGSDQLIEMSLEIPFEDWPEAVGIQIQRERGEIILHAIALYVDADADFLDEAQERQIGTSDHEIDSDGDGLSDYDEVFVYGTDPANPDTDGDGMNDGSEVANGLNPLEDDAQDDLDGDGVDNLTEILQGRDPTVGAVEDTEGVVNLKVYTVLE